MVAVVAPDGARVDLPGVTAMMTKRVIPIALLLAVSAAAVAAAPLTGGNIEAGQKKATVCAGCHGVDGNSPNPQFPRLAGQHGGYIVQQLQLFKSGKRSSPIMATMAGTVSEQDMKDLAAYFAAQEAKPGEMANAELAQSGAQIYNKGRPESGVAACSACHGPAGLGNPAAGFPRISGQYAVYSEKELKKFRDGTRGDYPQAAIMHGIASGLSNHDIEAVAAYVAGLMPDQSN